MAQTGARADSARNPLSLSDLDTANDDDPRILDLRIAERLGFDRPRDIRKLVERNRAELEAYGEFCATVAQNSDSQGRGRPGTDYWLNEPQVLLVCMLSRTPAAAAVRREVIRVFMAWRWGQLPTAKPARLSLRDMERARQLVAECRRLRGDGAARALWREVGLPVPAPEAPMRADPPARPAGLDVAAIAGRDAEIARLRHREAQLLAIIDRLSVRGAP